MNARRFAAPLVRQQGIEQRTAEVDEAAAERERIRRRLVEDDDWYLNASGLRYGGSLSSSFSKTRWAADWRVQFAFAFKYLLVYGLSVFQFVLGIEGEMAERRQRNIARHVALLLLQRVEVDVSPPRNDAPRCAGVMSFKLGGAAANAGKAQELAPRGRVTCDELLTVN